jgi:putative oxidoreductase
MTMFELPAERTPDRIDLIRTWVPRIAMSLFFLSFGSQKFSDRYWIDAFATIGVGDWLRYVTGSLQIGGGLLLLIPRTALIGTAMLAVTMIGAMLAWMFFLGSPGSAVIPAVILAMLIAIGLNARTSRTSRPPRT